MTTKCRYPGNVLAILALTLLSAGAHAIGIGVIHHDTFETDDPTSYSVNFGAPDIVGPAGPFTSRSARFQSVGANGPCCYYDQIQYAIPDLIQTVYLDFDIFVTDLIGSRNAFTVLFDAPLVNTFNLDRSGDIRHRFQAVGTYANDTPMHFSMYFSIPDDVFSVSLDGTLLSTRRVFDQGVRNLRSVRFSFGSQVLGGPDSRPLAFLDNVIISTEPIEKPRQLTGPAWLYPLGLVIAWPSLRRRLR